MDMSENYRPMWESLGLNLEAHDALLDVLGTLYQQTFLNQKNRPKGMEYFDFVMSEVHGLRIKELLDAKEKGQKVIGSFCVFVPEEIVLALDNIFVGLCAGAEFATEEAEKYLPRNTCALIKGAFGFALSKVCPFLEAADLVVGENTCDGKKKGFEIFKDFVNDFHTIDLPQMKNEVGRDLLKTEFLKFAAKLESISGRKLNVDNLKNGINVVNAKRSAMHRLASLRAADPSPISGLDALLANQVFFYDNPTRFTESVEKICDELEQRISENQGVTPKGAPRILISGCPMAVPNWKIPAIIESSGAIIVGEESCVGERGTQHLTSDQGDSVAQLVDNIVDRYMKIDCAVFTPNQSRQEHIIEMAKKYKADGIIQYSLQFCSPYQIESGSVEQTLKDQGIPSLRIDTDYGTGDVEQIKTRIGAFIEQLNQ
jgi:benzoyl-CoA reductase/2-hydroxyglutaryl-CoA dehydratase subunit BcrC/BadD/HgdB